MKNQTLRGWRVTEQELPDLDLDEVGVEFCEQILATDSVLECGDEPAPVVVRYDQVTDQWEDWDGQEPPTFWCYIGLPPVSNEFEWDSEDGAFQGFHHPDPSDLETEKCPKS